MTQVPLDASLVVAVVRELVAARMSELVRMRRERQPADLARARDHVVRVPVCHRSPAFRDEHVWARRILTLQPPEGSQFKPTNRVHARPSVLQPSHVEGAGPMYGA